MRTGKASSSYEAILSLTVCYVSGLKMVRYLARPKTLMNHNPNVMLLTIKIHIPEENSKVQMDSDMVSWSISVSDKEYSAHKDIVNLRLVFITLSSGS